MIREKSKQVHMLNGVWYRDIDSQWCFTLYVIMGVYIAIGWLFRRLLGKSCVFLERKSITCFHVEYQHYQRQRCNTILKITQLRRSTQCNVMFYYSESLHRFVCFHIYLFYLLCHLCHLLVCHKFKWPERSFASWQESLSMNMNAASNSY